MKTSEFETLVPRLQEAIRLAVTEALTASARLIAEEAKTKIIGVGDPSWPAFAESTEQAKDRRGPLLRTEELRESIEYVVVGHEAEIGSNDPVAVYQEQGTEHNPPRPFLATAALHKSEEVATLIGEAVANVFRGIR